MDCHNEARGKPLPYILLSAFIGANLRPNKMKAQEFFQEIEEGKILPFYYFYGPEKWLLEEALRQIKQKALNPATLDFNLAVFDAPQESAEVILDSLRVFPLNSPRRLVVIRQADTVWTKEADSYLEYFLNPNPSACAIFLGEKADLRLKFFQALEKKGAVVAFYHLPEREAGRWLRRQAEQLGYTLSPEALSLLLERVGPHLRELQGELQKLTLLTKAKKQIQEEDVLNLTDDVREETPFELSRAVGHFAMKKTFHLLRKNLQQGDSPLLLLSLVIRHLRLLRKAQELRVKGHSRREVEAKLKILPSRAEDFWQQVEKFPPAAMEEAWPLTWEADKALKSSRSDKGLILEKYLWDLFLKSKR